MAIAYFFGRSATALRWRGASRGRWPAALRQSPLRPLPPPFPAQSPTPPPEGLLPSDGLGLLRFRGRGWARRRRTPGRGGGRGCPRGVRAATPPPPPRGLGLGVPTPEPYSGVSLGRFKLQAGAETQPPARSTPTPGTVEEGGARGQRPSTAPRAPPPPRAAAARAPTFRPRRRRPRRRLVGLAPGRRRGPRGRLDAPTATVDAEVVDFPPTGAKPVLRRARRAHIGHGGGGAAAAVAAGARARPGGLRARRRQRKGQSQGGVRGPAAVAAPPSPLLRPLRRLLRR